MSATLKVYSSSRHYILKVHDTGTDEVKQDKSYKIAVIEAGKPECRVVSQNLTCPSSSLNTINCSRSGLGSLVVVDLSNTNLQSITTTAGASVALTYDSFRHLNQGPLFVNMSGTCCTPTVSVKVINWRMSFVLFKWGTNSISGTYCKSYQRPPIQTGNHTT